MEDAAKVDPAEVEIALSELARPWQICNTGGYYLPHPMSWDRTSVVEGTWKSDTPRKLTEEQAHLLREMLLKLNCHIRIRNRVIFISGKLPLAIFRAKQAPL